MSLLAAFMWGTWFISLKYLGDYPLEAFYITLFTSSLVLVTAVGYFLDHGAFFTNIRDTWIIDPSRVYVTFICGVLYVAGMIINLQVVKVLGLSLSQPLQASINLIFGTLISGLLGGIPKTMTLFRIVLSGAFLLLAIILTMKAGSTRTNAQIEKKINVGLSTDTKLIRKSIIFLIIGSFFIPAYSTALTYGLASVTQQYGMAVMPFMFILCLGAFCGAMIFGGWNLTKRKQWGVIWNAGFKIHKFGIISGFAHYGGNIIHTFATRQLSSVVSWPLGVTAGLWTQMWGLIYGEYKGSPIKTYLYLASGIISYLIGAVIISNII